MISRSAWSLALCGLLLSAGATSAAEEGRPEGNDSENSDKLAQVTVTGTRIVRDGYTAPTPVTVATTEDLTLQTPTSIPDALNKLPQFQMSQTPAGGLHNWPNADSQGNELNLRAVGTLRTLILLDGVRMPPTTYFGNVDVDVIPNLLLQRVEIVTGGASAAYGSDAVAGVVNFVLDKNFTGIKGAVQGGLSNAGDNRNNRIALGGGFKFADDRGHAMFSFEEYKNDGMLRSARPAGAEGWIYAGSNTHCTGSAAACTAGGPSNPFTLVPQGRLTSGSNLGLIASGPTGFPYLRNVFLPNNTVTPFNPGTPTGSPGFASGGDGFGIPTDVSSVAPLQTFNFFGRGDFQFTPDVAGYLQAVASRFDENYTSQANAWISSPYAPIYSGNPYLPAAVQAAMGPNDKIGVAEYNGEGEKPYTQERTDFGMISSGLSGKFGGGWTWRADYTHGQTKHYMDQSGQYYWARAYAALDAVRDPATGNTVCRTSLDPNPAIRAQYAGCQPMDILGVDPAVATPAGYAYATGTSSYRAQFKQDDAQISLSGSPLSLPAGPVDLAVGAEYRRSSLLMTSNGDPGLLATPAEQAARYAGLRGVSAAAMLQNFWLTNIGSANGSEHVEEGFAELNIPILKGLPAVEQLAVNGAIRYTDYSTSGSVHTWKAGVEWRPITDLMLRGTASRDIRAPELLDLFTGDQFNIGLVYDPVTNTSANIPQVTGASPHLKPETAKTYTYGLAFTPSFGPLEGASLSVDYYDIDINGAFGTENAVQVVADCAANAAAPECALITRPSPTSFPTSVRLVETNMSFLKTSGVDFDGSYRKSVGPGRLSLRLYANHLLTYETQQNSTSPVLDYKRVDEVSTSISDGHPGWSGLLSAEYEIDKWQLLAAERYIGAMKIARPGLPSNFVDSHAPAIAYTDLTVARTLDAYDGAFSVFFTVNNLFGKDPPLIPSTVPGSTYPTIIGVYDYIGRTYVAGVRFKF
jgi:iron complex outermembrane receptor protein